MGLAEAVFLGILQGLTEFLPVSSSGHLVLAQTFLGVKMPGATFEVILHAGTLLSIIWVFWNDIYKLISGFTKNEQQKKLFLLLVIGTIPAGLIGIIFSSFFKGLFERPVTVGFMLLLTGCIVWLVNILGKKQGGASLEAMTWKDAIVIGLFQALAIIPGISRSGSTIFGALLNDLNRETAVRFSFLLALPAIAGATVIEVGAWLQTGAAPDGLIIYLSGAVFAFVAGVFAIRTFIRLLAGGKFHYFAYYCWFAGAFSILYFLL